ncbi:MAG: flagellar hook-basal body complex protein [Aquabacterium sp.]
MMNSFYVAALGMQAQKSQLDVVSNNLSNANTAGYKRERVDFSALLDRQVQNVAAADQAGKSQPLSNLRRDLTQGELQATDSVLDIAINGQGLLEVSLNDGRTAYVRGGSLKINDDGYLVTAGGLPLRADVRIPAMAAELAIDARGVVSARLGQDSQRTELGRLQLVQFGNLDALNYLGNGVFEAPQGMEPALKGNPDEDGLGAIASGKLELSNVKLVDEMVSLMMAQRVYELNAKVVQAADEVMAMTNSLRRA